MASHVAVVGSGPRAAGWATRFLAAGLDVVVTDPALPTRSPNGGRGAERLGLFPGASTSTVCASPTTSSISPAPTSSRSSATARRARPGARLVATDDDGAARYEPIHLLPLVELADGPDQRRLRARSTRRSAWCRCMPDVARRRAVAARSGPGRAGRRRPRRDHRRHARAAAVGASAPAPAIAEHEARRLAAAADHAVAAGRPVRCTAAGCTTPGSSRNGSTTTAT